jgi:hypothetical protein
MLLRSWIKTMGRWAASFVALGIGLVAATA